jgi:lipopolysaccharide heptosyltransferase II
MSLPSPLRPGDRVLVTRLHYLGDVVLSLPLVDALRRCAPGVEVDYLSRRTGAELLRGDARFARVFEWRDGARPAAAMIADLRARGYRAVIDLYSNPRSAWITFATGAPTRVGADRRGRRWLYTHRLRAAGVRAVTEVFLAYGEPLGVHGAAAKPTLVLSGAEERAAEELMERAGARGPVPGRPRIGVHPGGKWDVKRWPAGKFAALVEHLHDRRGAQVLLFTGPDEVEATARVARAVGAKARVLPALSVREAAAVIARLDALVACDGGIMHVGVAVGTPTVGIFGSSEAEVWFPYEHLGPYRAARIPVDCRPCHRHVCPLGHTRCLNELDVTAVAARIDEVVAVGRSGVAR